MDRRVDPSTTLREKDQKFFWDMSVANGLRQENNPALGKLAKHQSRQESIFSKKQKVLFMKRLDRIFRVFLHNIGIH
jgi:hypothetical protein